jgi:hypothetical protein
MPLKQVWYHNIMVIVMAFAVSFLSPYKKAQWGQVFLGLSDLTIVQNSHAHCAKIDMSAVQIHLAHLCKE